MQCCWLFSFLLRASSTEWVSSCFICRLFKHRTKHIHADCEAAPHHLLFLTHTFRYTKHTVKENLFHAHSFVCLFVRSFACSLGGLLTCLLASSSYTASDSVLILLDAASVAKKWINYANADCCVWKPFLGGYVSQFFQFFLSLSGLDIICTNFLQYISFYVMYVHKRWILCTGKCVHVYVSKGPKGACIVKQIHIKLYIYYTYYDPVPNWQCVGCSAQNWLIFQSFIRLLWTNNIDE